MGTPALQLSFQNTIRLTKGVAEVCISEHNDFVLRNYGFRLGKVYNLSHCIEKSLVLFFESSRDLGSSGMATHLLCDLDQAVQSTTPSFLFVMGDTSLLFRLLENWTC